MIIIITIIITFVQIKMAFKRSEKPIFAPPRLSEVSPTLPFEQFHCSSDWRRPLFVLSRKIVERLLFPRLSPPGDRWSDGLDFVPAVNVSSSSRLQILRDVSHLWWLLFPPVYLFDHSVVIMQVLMVVIVMIIVIVTIITMRPVRCRFPQPSATGRRSGSCSSHCFGSFGAFSAAPIRVLRGARQDQGFIVG